MARARLLWRWCRVHPRTSGSGAAVLALVVLAGALGNSGQESTPTAAGASTSRAPSPSRMSAAPVDRAQRGQTTALALLATIPIKGRAPKTGYDRAEFGSAWTDDNDDPLGHNGCDTRNDVLRRDLTSIALKPDSNGCTVVTGVLRDQYTATTIQFSRGQSTSDAVQIDHVVSLSESWQTGASRWTAQTRTNLANDPLNLLAVDGPRTGPRVTVTPPRGCHRTRPTDAPSSRARSR